MDGRLPGEVRPELQASLHSKVVGMPGKTNRAVGNLKVVIHQFNHGGSIEPGFLPSVKHRLNLAGQRSGIRSTEIEFQRDSVDSGNIFGQASPQLSRQAGVHQVDFQDAIKRSLPGDRFQLRQSIGALVAVNPAAQMIDLPKGFRGRMDNEVIDLKNCDIRRRLKGPAQKLGPAENKWFPGWRFGFGRIVKLDIDPGDRQFGNPKVSS